jgi:dimethylhistidine N-methyltransferase
VQFYDHPPEPEDAAAQVLDGLSRARKSISPKFFYDEYGSELFTAITRQPEYYPTRTEMSLLRGSCGELKSLIGDNSVLIEYGSGNSEKIRLLLESLRPKVYAPLDISRDFLAKAAESVAVEFPWLEVRATCIDYTRDFDLPFEVEGRKVGFFPGSSIGNFSRAGAQDFLGRVNEQLGTDGALVIGVDMKKDEAVLNLAYNDKAGVTAAFNKNVLTHLNREFGADFDLDHFEHLARYNETEGCIQMFLVSQKDQDITVADQLVHFRKGEKVHTENSHKYAKAEFLAMASRAGFSGSRTWQDDDGWFSLFYLCNEDLCNDRAILRNSSGSLR